MELEAMRALLEASIPGKRYKHSYRVYETALELAKAHALSEELLAKVAVSALLHDCGREVGSKESVAKARELNIALDAIEVEQPVLIHAKLGYYNAQHKYEVHDEDVLQGILLHTTGAAQMSVLAKIVFLADMIEPARDFPGVEKLRTVAAKDLDKAMLLAYSNTMRYLLDEGQLIHPSCIAGYNEELQIVKEKR